MNVGDLVRAMGSIAPLALAAPWDNVGLLVGDAQAALSRVLVAVDCTQAVVDEARRERCEAIVSYHPVLFEAQKTFVAGSVAFDLCRAGIAVYSPHTAFDAVDGGANDVLADVLRMESREALRPATAYAPHREGGEGREHASASPRVGFGRVGDVAPRLASALVEDVKSTLGLSRVLTAGPIERRVSRAAVCAGSGGDLLKDAIARGAQLFLTGELRHHDALLAASRGLVVVCVLHSTSERCALARLEQQLRVHLAGATIVRSAADREPFVLA